MFVLVLVVGCITCLLFGENNYPLRGNGSIKAV